MDIIWIILLSLLGLSFTVCEFLVIIYIIKVLF